MEIELKNNYAAAYPIKITITIENEEEKDKIQSEFKEGEWNLSSYSIILCKLNKLLT